MHNCATKFKEKLFRQMYYLNHTDHSLQLSKSKQFLRISPTFFEQKHNILSAKFRYFPVFHEEADPKVKNAKIFLKKWEKANKNMSKFTTISQKYLE